VDEVEAIISENAKRLRRFTDPYDPLTGEGSMEEREGVVFSDIGTEIKFPKPMFEDPMFRHILTYKSVTDWANMMKTRPGSDWPQHLKDDPNSGFFMLDNLRHKYDPEYWFYTTISIQDKEDLSDTPFKLRRAQRILLKELLKMFWSGTPIRIVLLKARQWGGSTLVQMFMFWIQQIHKRNWHLAVCAQDDGAANNISEMYRRAASTYPKEFGNVRFKPYARSPKNIVNVERGGIIGVGSINNPKQFRSFSYPMIHLSEPGVWEDTPKRTAAQLVASLRSIVLRRPFKR
jgi:hypothetical protein